MQRQLAFKLDRNLPVIRHRDEPTVHFIQTFVRFKPTTASPLTYFQLWPEVFLVILLIVKFYDGMIEWINNIN